MEKQDSVDKKPKAQKEILKHRSKLQPNFAERLLPGIWKRVDGLEATAIHHQKEVGDNLETLESIARKLIDVTRTSNEMLKELRRELTVSTKTIIHDQEKVVLERTREQDKQIAQLREDVRALTRIIAIGDEKLPFDRKLDFRGFRLWSQNLEDGMLYTLFKQIGMTNATFAEICCGDNGGNSGFLAELGWNGLMIDGDDEALAVTRRLFGRRGVRVVKDWVTAENINTLLTENGIRGEIDFLSLDIDGNDYWVWKAMTAINPRVVMAEYNPNFGPTDEVTIPYDGAFGRHGMDDLGPLAKFYYGVSLAGLVKLAREKGYRLIATERSGVNALFLRNDVAAEIPEIPVADAFRVNELHQEKLAKFGSFQEFVKEKNLPLVKV